MSQRPLQPVAPESMEMLFIYSCPFCHNQVGVLSPFQPAMARCGACGKGFPIMPVDERSVRYVKLMLANGRAAVDPDFV